MSSGGLVGAGRLRVRRMIRARLWGALLSMTAMTAPQLLLRRRAAAVPARPAKPYWNSLNAARSSGSNFLITERA